MSAEKGFVRSLTMKSSRFLIALLGVLLVVDVANVLFNIWQSHTPTNQPAIFIVIIWISMTISLIVRFNQLWRESWIQLVPLTMTTKYLLTLLVNVVQAIIWALALFIIVYANSLIYGTKVTVPHLTIDNLMVMALAIVTTMIWSSILTSIGVAMTRFVPKRFGRLVRIVGIVIISWLASLGFGFVIHQVIFMFEDRMHAAVVLPIFTVVVDGIGVLIAIYLLKNWMESRVR